MITSDFMVRAKGGSALTPLARSVSGRLETLRAYRISWWAYWAECAEMYLPHRYRWFTTPNKYNRGSPKNQQIVDETGLLAARVLATGLLSGLTSPTKPWFRLGVAGVAEMPEGPEKIWLANTTRTLLEILAGTNLYECLGQMYYDGVVFGTSPLLMFEDHEDLIRFYVAPAGEYFLGVSSRLTVDTMYREFTYTAKQTVEEFGFDNCSANVQGLAKASASLDTETVLCHAIEPNVEVTYGGQRLPSPIPSIFKFREVYWERGQTGGTGQTTSHIMRFAGYREDPFVAMRWDVTANDPYGRGPGMYGLPAVLQTQVQTRRQAEAIDKQVRPPMVGSVAMKNEPQSILPGGVTYVPDPAAAGFKPAFTVQPQLTEMDNSLEVTRKRIKSIHFNDLFLGISDLGTVRTATEIEARKQEIAIQIGPVIERTENEVLAKIIIRTYAIAKRRGLIQPPPQSLQTATLSIRYISMLAETQRAAGTAGIERLAAFVGNLVAVRPESLDKINVDRMIEVYADMIDSDPSLINSDEVVTNIRKGRAQAQQQQAQLQTAMAGAQGAQTLSKTDVGGGQNALSLMLGREAA